MGFEIDLIAAKLRREAIVKRQMPIRDRTALSVEIEGLSKANIQRRPQACWEDPFWKGAGQRLSRSAGRIGKRRVPRFQRLISTALHRDRRASVVFDETQLRRVLKNFASYYNQIRTHLEDSVAQSGKLGAAPELWQSASPRGKVLVKLGRESEAEIQLSIAACIVDEIAQNLTTPMLLVGPAKFETEIKR